MKPKKNFYSISSSRTAPAPTRAQIEALAHAIWIDGGQISGRELDDWLEAERQLRGGAPRESTSAATTGTGGVAASAPSPRSSEVIRDIELDPGRSEAARIDRELEQVVSPPVQRSPTSL